MNYPLPNKNLTLQSLTVYESVPEYKSYFKKENDIEEWAIANIFINPVVREYTELIIYIPNICSVIHKG